MEENVTRRAPGGRRWGRRTWLGLAVSLAFLVLLLARVERAEMVEALRGVQPAWFAPAALLLAGALWVRALRWRQILRPSLPLSARDAASLVVIGYAANNVLPARAGDATIEEYRWDFDDGRGAETSGKT